MRASLLVAVAAITLAQGADPQRIVLTRVLPQPNQIGLFIENADGTQLVFVSTRAGGTADLWIMDLKTRAAKALTSGPGVDFRPSWSPDGQWIAFSSDRTSDLPSARGRWEQQWEEGRPAWQPAQKRPMR